MGMASMLREYMNEGAVSNPVDPIIPDYTLIPKVKIT